MLYINIVTHNKKHGQCGGTIVMVAFIKISYNKEVWHSINIKISFNDGKTLAFLEIDAAYNDLIETTTSYMRSVLPDDTTTSKIEILSFCSAFRNLYIH